MRVGVIGATGMVGQLMRTLLDERDFPVEELRLFASERSAGRPIQWRDQTITVEDAATANFTGLDVALFSAGATTSRALAERVAGAGAIVIDNSSAWRMDDEVPLVVPEVNASALDAIPKGIVANPNCTTMVAIVAVKPLHDAFGLNEMIISTYQAVSGAGVSGVRELAEQAEKLIGDVDLLATDTSVAGNLSAQVFPLPVAFNVIPLAGRLVDDETDEEHKFRNESRKILGLPSISVTCTCVRVPVVTGHSSSITATFDRPVDLEVARAALEAAPAVRLSEIPNPLAVAGTDESLVGRLRRDQNNANRLTFFVSGDNLRKGAALNTIQIAETLIARGRFS